MTKNHFHSRRWTHGQVWRVCLLMTCVFGCDDPASSDPSPDATGMDMGMPAHRDAHTPMDTQLSQDTGTSILDSTVDIDASSTSDMDVPLDMDAPLDGAMNLDADLILDAGLPDAEFGEFDLGGVDAGAVGCVSPEARFQFSIWPRVIDGRCTNCHIEMPEGEPQSFAQSEGSRFLILDPDTPGRGQDRSDVFAENLERMMAVVEEDDGSPLLVPKALGQLGHRGGEQFGEDSEPHRLLLEFIDLYQAGEDPACNDDLDEAPTLNDVMSRIELRSPEEMYRAFTVQTMGRLPNAGELNRIRSAEDGGPGLMPGIGNMPGAGRGGAGAGEQPQPQARAARSGMSVARDLIYYHSGRSGLKPWLKDMWNDVFMFRGIYVQELDRPYEVFHGEDFGARVWSDLCGVKVPLTDENGDYIDDPDDQPYCNLEAQRFAYPPVVQPNVNGAGRNLTPEEACYDCTITRHGMARLQLYGAVEEPLELIAHIIQNDRPFTEIVTSDTVMMNYYTSLVYFGSADPGLNDFTADMDDVPMRRDFLSGPDYIRFQADLPDHRYFRPMNRVARTRNREYSIPGFERATKNGREILFKAEPEFPRSGILTSAAFMKRFPSSDLNVNRHRAWQTMRLLLDYDVLRNQGERISLADEENPNGGATMTNADCASCHQILDPVSGLFQDFAYTGKSLFPGPNENLWPEALHAAGTGGIGGGDVVYDRAVHGPSIQFLGQRLAEDPRFAQTMVRYAWTQVMGHPPLDDAEGLEGRDFEARSALILAQQRFIQSLTERFVRENYNMRMLYVQLFTSTWYRIKSLGPVGDTELSDDVYTGVGRHGTVTPEEYFRRIEAAYGAPWPLRGGSSNYGRRLTTESELTWDFFTTTDSLESGNTQFDLLYGLLDANFSAFFGGIDFQNNLNRAKQMNAVMSLVARRVANEFACLTVYPDLQKPARQRRFFGAIPNGVVEGGPPEGQARAVIAHLFDRILGQSVDTRGADVTLAYELFLDIQSLVQIQIEADPSARWFPEHCAINGSTARGDLPEMNYPDPTGQIRGWMAVVTYLLLQPEFIQR